MTETENGLRLSPFEQFPLMEDQKVYRLETGRIQVYILSEKNGEVGAPCLYCEIRDTDRSKAIPALSYVDEAQTKWFLSITSADEGAVLSLTPGQATSIPTPLILTSLLCFHIRLVHVEQHIPYRRCYNFER